MAYTITSPVNFLGNGLIDLGSCVINNYKMHSYIGPTSGPYLASSGWAQLTGLGTASPGHDVTGMLVSNTVTIPKSGTYIVSAAVTFEANNTGTIGLIGSLRGIRQVRVYRSNVGDTLLFGERAAEAYDGNPTRVHAGCAVLKLDEGDTIMVQIRHDATSSLNIISTESGETFLTVCLLL